MTDTRYKTKVTVFRPPHPLIGREREMATAMQLLASEARVLTLTGIGGIGKTRLTHQLGLEMEPQFAGGALFVPLADVRTVDDIPREIMRSMGQTQGTADLVTVISALGALPTLLLLDNLEQIPEAGSFVAELSQAVPSTVIICASQQPLEIPGEYVLALDPLPAEPTDSSSPANEIRELAAVRLFIDRARKSNPAITFTGDDLKIAAEICQVLGGIPLAIELAAARLSIFSLPTLRDSLRDQLDVLSGGGPYVPERHRTMRNSITWTYSLLDSTEQRLFRYLAMFANPISLEAIAHTARRLEITDHALDVVSFLVSRSLIRRIPEPTKQPQFTMLPILREFAIEQAIAEGDEYSARLSQAQYVASMLEESADRLVSRDQATWLTRLANEEPSILAATSWAAKHNPELALQIIGAGSLWMDRTLKAAVYAPLGWAAIRATADQTTIPALAWVTVGKLEVRLRENLQKAATVIQRGLDIARLAQDVALEAEALTALATCQMSGGNYKAAEEYYGLAHNCAEQHSLPDILLRIAVNRAIMDFYQGDAKSARDQILQILPLVEKSDDLTTVAQITANLAAFHNSLGEFQQAKDVGARSLTAARALGFTHILPFVLHTTAITHINLGDFSAAADHIQEEIQILQRRRFAVEEQEARGSYVTLAWKQGDKPEVVRRIIDALRVTDVPGAGRAILTCGAILIAAASDSDQVADLLRTLGAIDALQDSTGYRLSPPADIEEQIEQFRENHRTASDLAVYEEGTKWSLAELSRNAIRIAQEYLAKRGAEETTSRSPSRPNLTPREREVLGMLAKGHTNAEIADEMFISLRTITTHVSNIFAKLDVKNRSAAIARALNEQLV